jgi:hypothetical protein
MMTKEEIAIKIGEEQQALSAMGISDENINRLHNEAAKMVQRNHDVYLHGLSYVTTRVRAGLSIDEIIEWLKAY